MARAAVFREIVWPWAMRTALWPGPCISYAVGWILKPYNFPVKLFVGFWGRYSGWTMNNICWKCFIEPGSIRDDLPGNQSRNRPHRYDDDASTVDYKFPYTLGNKFSPFARRAYLTGRWEEGFDSRNRREGTVRSLSTKKKLKLWTRLNMICTWVYFSSIWAIPRLVRMYRAWIRPYSISAACSTKSDWLGLSSKSSSGSRSKIMSSA